MTERATAHEPVMTAEVVTALDPSRGGLFVDCTVGAGGHARVLLQAGADRVLGLDRDAEALPVAADTLRPWADRVDLAHADFRTLDDVLAERGIGDIDGGALADLGLSSLQLDGEGTRIQLPPATTRSTCGWIVRGGPRPPTLLRAAREAELADVIHGYGEDRYARRIARGLVAIRQREPLTSTGQLSDAVRRAVPRRNRQRIHPATRTFQALRIWVNRELDGLDAWVPAVCSRLRAGARLAVITFHSLEDRIVKRALRGLEQKAGVAIEVLTRRPVRPSAAEIARNPRARSAKLRAAQRLA